MIINGFQWLSRVFSGYYEFSMVIRGFQWLSMVFYGYRGVSMVIGGFQLPTHVLELAPARVVQQLT